MLIFKTEPKVENKIEETVVNENLNTSEELNEFFCSEAYIDDTLMEMARISYQLEAGLLIADLKSEVAVLEGVDTPEVILEAVGKEFFAKAKKAITDFFSKIWNAIKSFFDMLMSQVVSNKKFAQDYGEAVMAKTATGYLVTGYDYTPSEGIALVKRITDKLTLKGNDQADAIVAATKKTVEDEKGEFVKGNRAKELFAAIGYGETTAEVVKAIRLAFHNGKEEPTKDVPLENLKFGKKDMLDILKRTDLYGPVDENKKIAKNGYNTFIKAVNSLTSEYSSLEEKEKQRCISNVNELVSYYKVEASLLLSICTTQFAIYRDLTKHCSKTLRGYLAYKPASKVKEEPAKTTESVDEGIFEQALRLV